MLKTCTGLMVVIGLTVPATAAELTVAFWNVENLFDEYDDPQLSSEDVLTATQVRQKLAKDAEIIRKLDADIIGLMEVENHALLRRLCTEALRGQGYVHFMLLEGKDPRGIDVALISRHPFLARSYAVPDFPRGILAARFSFDGQPLYVLVNHWKSRHGGGEEKRKAAAQVVKQIVTREIPRYEGRDVPVIVGGDLNDNDDDASVKLLEDGGLINTFRNQSTEQRWTIGYYDQDRRKMNLDGFDHLLVNQAARRGDLLEWKSSRVERPRVMLNERVISGQVYQMPLDDYRSRIGYSDHFPVMGTFELKRQR